MFSIQGPPDDPLENPAGVGPDLDLENLVAADPGLERDEDLGLERAPGDGHGPERAVAGLLHRTTECRPRTTMRCPDTRTRSHCLGPGTVMVPLK